MESVDSDNIKKKVGGAGKSIVIFHADWCPFCRRFVPIFKSYEGKYNAQLLDAKVNEDSNPLWDTFKVEVIPTIVAFSSGKEIARRNGKAGIGLTKEDMDSLLKEISA